MDVLALLLEDDGDEFCATEINIPCLDIDHNAHCVYLTIEDCLFDDDKYSEKLQIILKYLKNDKDLNKNNECQKFDLSIDLSIDLNEEKDALFALKYMLELSKKYITSLSVYITAFGNRRLASLDKDTLSNIFSTIRDSVCEYRLQNITLHWTPADVSNYVQIQHGIVNILNLETSKQISINILFTCAWLSRLNVFDPLGIFMKAIKQCEICNDLTLKLDSFNELSLRNVIQIFDAISCNPYISSLSVFAENICTNNEIVNALRDCLRCKENIETLCLSLSLEDDRDLCSILRGLRENDSICLSSLCLYRNGTNWESKSIELICDLLGSEQHNILQLELDGVFVPSYSFGMYRVTAFDKLINCLTRADDLELQILKIATISDDGDSDIYTDYVLQLIKESNIWLRSIAITYERFNSINTIISAFFYRLQWVYKSLVISKMILSDIIRRNDIVNLIIEFCKMECFEIFIVDNEDYDHAMDLGTERAEFQRRALKIAKNRKEFQKFTQKVSSGAVGIWRQSFKQPQRCITVIL